MRKILWLGILLVLTDRAQAEVNIWQVPSASGTGNWSVAANWSANRIPIATDDLVFPATSATTVLVDVNANALSLTLQESYVFTPSGGGTLTLHGGIEVQLGANSISAELILPAGDHEVEVAQGSFILQEISGAGRLVKTGDETLFFSGPENNTHTGGTEVREGRLDVLKDQDQISIPGPLTIGQAGASNEAMVYFQGPGQLGEDLDVTMFGNGVFNLNGHDQTIGSLNMTGGSIIMVGEFVTAILTLSGDLTATSTQTGVLVPIISGLLTLSNASHTFTVADGPSAKDLNIEAILGGSETAELVKSGPGVLELSGTTANTFLGTTRVNEGTLSLNKSTGIALQNEVFVGDGEGGTDADVLKWLRSDQLADDTLMEVHESGVANLDGNVERIATGNLRGGHIQTGVGNLSLGTFKTFASKVEARYEGFLPMSSALRLDVEDGPAAIDLRISALISGDFTISKFLPGTLLLSGTNGFISRFNVNEGTVVIGSPQALGQPDGETVVDPNAILTSAGDLTVAEEPLVLKGAGPQGRATWQVPGNLTWTGPITLDSDSTIDITGTLTASVNHTIEGPGGLTKTGAGRLNIAQNNTYNGETHILEGTVSIRQPEAFGSIIGGTAIADGVTLELDGSFGVVGEELQLGNPGPGGSVLLTSTGGESRWLGPIHLDSSVTLQIDDPNDILELGHGISGTGSVTKMGPGTLRLAGSVSNTYSGLTTITDGPVLLDKIKTPDPNAIAIPGHLVIGNGTQPALVRLPEFRREQISDTARVTLNPQGTLDLSTLAAPSLETVCEVLNLGGTLTDPNQRLRQTQTCAPDFNVPDSSDTSRGLLTLLLTLVSLTWMRRKRNLEEPR